jgi:ferrochelatase
MKNDYSDSKNKIGILISNLGTPRSTSTKDLRSYLNQFLMDKRVVDLPRMIWLPILKLIILNIRPRKSAKLYKSIWTKDGSPLMVFSKNIVKKLSNSLDTKFTVALGMRYGTPSLEEALNSLRKQKISNILILPLYPQAGSPTTSSTFDTIAQYLKKISWMPNLTFVSGYHDYPNYINSLAKSINASFQKNGKPDKLIFSFHGMPKRYLDNGDPYYCFCHKTTRLVSEKLNLDENFYEIAFQSRFGSEKWLEPYMDKILINEARNGTKHIQVISPGFAVDCLETLEEINIQYRELFLKNGGRNFEYISCLNDSDDQIDLLQSIIHNHTKHWAL